MTIPFNKPYLTGNEYHYMSDAVSSLKLSGNGKYTRMCHEFFESTYGFGKCLLTTSCTDALEMSALLMDLKEGDEVIMPSYTFVSTANAFVLRGVKIVFADSRVDHPGIDEESIESLISPNTKAIVVVHYAGVACDMDIVMDIAERHGVYVVEDAAQAIDSYYVKNGSQRALGSIGHFAAFSFHETKNIISGEGGMLVVNDERFAKRAEIIWEKGTNRSAFFRGEVDKYGWVDVGSSFLPSEIIAAFLYAQIEKIEKIQGRRKAIWNQYNELLRNINSTMLSLPQLPAFATNNGHMFYLVAHDLQLRRQMLTGLKSKGIHAVFHYLSLHKSRYYEEKHSGKDLPQCDHFSDCLFRLPFFNEISDKEVKEVSEAIIELALNCTYEIITNDG